MLVIDAHLDLAMNAIQWNRDLELPVLRTRELEAGMDQKGRARGTVAFPEMRAGRVGICVATVIARVSRAGNPLSGYASAEIAHAVAQGQRHFYEVLQNEGKVRILIDWPSLDAHAREWLAFGDGQFEDANPLPARRGSTGVSPSRLERGSTGVSPSLESPADSPPIGVILSMEGADPIVSPEQLGRWCEDGLRIVGPAHYGVSAYAHGTATPGGLTPRGPALLEAMEELGILLDVTHLADESFWQALDIYSGPVLASHSNCRALVPGDRQLDDDQIRALVERGGVIGAAMDAWMLYPGWVKGETENSVVSLEAVADQIDRVCQLAGNTGHAAIGTDLDGGYGQEQCPHDLDTIADLQRIPALLRQRGYSEADVTAVMHGNWLRLFREAWGEGSEAGESGNQAQPGLPLDP